MTRPVTVDHSPLQCIDCMVLMPGLMSIASNDSTPGLAWMCPDCTGKRGLLYAKKIVQDIANGRRASA